METEDCKLIKEEIPSEEAKEKCPERYNPDQFIKKNMEEITTKGSDEEVLTAKSHYSVAEVDGTTYHLNDDALVKVDRATKDATIPDSNFYCDLFYQLPYNSLISVPSEGIREAGYVSSGLFSGSDRASGGSKDSCTSSPSSKS